MADVKVDIQTEYDSAGVKRFKKDTDKLRKDSLKKFGKAAKGVGLAAAAGFGLASAAALKFGADSVSLAKEQIAVEKQLESVLASTGNAAGLTADEIKDMASALQQTTNFGDEATLVGQNLLLTFTNIGKDTFPRATEAMLDMSVAMGQDLKSSAQQIGKALNDPVKGVTALTRVGVQFTDQQKEQIKILQESGDVVGAQAIILAELETQFKGSAAAAREADGGFIAAKNAMGDLQEEVGRGLLEQLAPIMEGAAVAIADVTPILAELTSEFFEELFPALQNAGEALGELAVALGLAEEGSGGLEGAIGILGGVFDVIVFSINSAANAVKIFLDLLQQVSDFIDLVQEADVGDFFRGAAGGFGAIGQELGVPEQFNIAQQLAGFQSGGQFTVGGSGGPDSELVQFKATPGEIITINNNINGIGGDQLGQLIRGAIEGALQEYTDTILIPSFE